MVKNGNVYYVGFYCRESAQIYSDIIGRYIVFPEMIDPNLEEVVLGDYTMYLNYGDYDIKLSGYDLIKEEYFDVVPKFGVVLIERKL